MMSCPRRLPTACRSVFLLLAVLICAQTAAAQDRIFAMADIHGAYDTASALLWQVGLIDGAGAWTGGENIFVQTGDYTDRGPEVRRVMDLLMALGEDAPSNAVTVLIGNHEMMNMMADLRDTTTADYAAFAEEDSQQWRERAYEQYVRFEREKAERRGLAPPQFGAEARQAWMADHPAGFLERREAFGPNGKYGQWLRSLPVVVRKGDTLFLHSGINPAFSSISIDAINARVRSEIESFDLLSAYLADAGVILPFFTFQEIVEAVREERDFVAGEIELREADAADAGETYESPDAEVRHLQLLDRFLEIGSWLSVHPEGVLWFRGYAQWADEEGAARIEPLLEAYDVERFVVGHTPQAGGDVTFRFGGAVVLLDTGMLSSVYMGGRGSMLEIVGETVRPIYLDGIR